MTEATVQPVRTSTTVPLSDATAPHMAAGLTWAPDEVTWSPWPPLMPVTVHLAVRILRDPRRGRCAKCDRRRELYRVVIGLDDKSEARCADCWWGQ